MTTWFVSRHPGALAWIQQRGVAFDQHVPHLDLAAVCAGDVVIGNLPVHLAGEVCARGAAYWHMVLLLPQQDRGRELSTPELVALGATLQRFDVSPYKLKPAP